MKVAVVGAGAIGGLLAAWIGSRVPGTELSAVARGATLQALRSHGLRWTEGDGLARVPLRASDRPGDLGVQDLVIVAVKGPALSQVAPAVAALCGPDTRVLMAMNGVPWWFFDHLPGPCQGLRLRSVDPDGQIAQAIPTQNVIGAVVHLSSSSPEPGVVRHAGGKGLIIGEPAGGESPRLRSLAELLTRAGFEVTPSPRIQQPIWFKLWGNLTMNPVSAITGATCDRILDDPLVRQFCSAVMLEARAVGAAFGIPIEQDPDERHAVTRKLGAFKTSMLMDAEGGRPLELDSIVSVVREIGQHLGLATPNIDTLLGLTRLMARQRGLYPGA